MKVYNITSLVAVQSDSTYSVEIPQGSSEELLAEFLALFPSRLDSCIRRSAAVCWRPMSRYHYLSDAEIIEAISGVGSLFRAQTMSSPTSCLVLLVPSASPYRTVDGVMLLREILESAGLHLSHYQIFDDWYFYAFLSEPIDTRHGAALLSQKLQSMHFVVGEGMLEVLSEGDLLPYPLQEGFTWLDRYCRPVVSRRDLSLEDSLRLFLCDAHRSILPLALEPLCGCP